MRRFIRSMATASALIALAGPMSARAQSIGAGASPGRAAYRPNSQWNNGPYFTVPHVDPYGPHRTSSTNLYFSEAMQPPWSLAPHGVYSTFYPGEGTLYPYAQGFSPYSGFSPWYVQSYNVDPTREVVQNARTLFFRSAPRPPDQYLPPLPPPRPVLIPVAAMRPTAGPVPSVGKVVVPEQPVAGPRPRTIPIYRSSVAGSP